MSEYFFINLPDKFFLKRTEKSRIYKTPTGYTFIIPKKCLRISKGNGITETRASIGHHWLIKVSVWNNLEQKYDENLIKAELFINFLKKNKWYE